MIFNDKEANTKKKSENKFIKNTMVIVLIVDVRLITRICKWIM